MAGFLLESAARIFSAKASFFEIVTIVKGEIKGFKVKGFVSSVDAVSFFASRKRGSLNAISIFIVSFFPVIEDK